MLANSRPIYRFCDACFDYGAQAIIYAQRLCHSARNALIGFGGLGHYARYVLGAVPPWREKIRMDYDVFSPLCNTRGDGIGN